MTNLRIPTHWTTDQAIIVLDLFEDLHRAVWDCYENRAVEAVMHEVNEPDCPDDGDISSLPDDPQDP